MEHNLIGKNPQDFDCSELQPFRHEMSINGFFLTGWLIAGGPRHVADRVDGILLKDVGTPLNKRIQIWLFNETRNQ